MNIKLMMLVSVLTLVGCGGGSGGAKPAGGGNDSGPTPSVTLTGVLEDSAVSGASYITTSGQQGVTNPRGEFNYVEGDRVTFTVAGFTLPEITAVQRVTPNTIASELFSGEGSDDVARVRNAALNLAILFQSLDSDSDPSNGISIVSGDAAPELSEFSPENLVIATMDFVSALQSANVENIPSLRDAMRHYYLNELAGNWYQHIPAAGDGLGAGAEQHRYVLIDAKGNFIRAEYRLGSLARDYLYTGFIEFDEESGALKTFSNGRVLRDGEDVNPGTISTEISPRAFGLTVSFAGEDLVFTRPNDNGGVDYTYTRFENRKGSPVGVWAELESSYNGVEGTIRNQGGDLDFGEQVVGLFSVYTQNRWVHIVLDRAPNADGDNCERNGLAVAAYEWDSSTQKVVIGQSLFDGVWVNPESCGKQLPFGGEVMFANRLFNDTVWTGKHDEEAFTTARNVSRNDLTAGFKQRSLVGSWRLVDHPESDTVLPVLNFLPNGRYVLGVVHDETSDCNTDEKPNALSNRHGIEYGHYEVAQGQVVFSDVTLETIGAVQCGLVNQDDSDIQEMNILDIDDEKLVLLDGEDRLEFRRIANNGIRGSWVVGNSTILSLLDDGYYMAAEFNNDGEDVNSFDGVEYGRYTLASNGDFRVTQVIVDTNGHSGFVDGGQLDASDFPVRLIVKNDSLSFGIEREGCYDAERVENHGSSVQSDACIEAD